MYWADRHNAATSRAQLWLTVALIAYFSAGADPGNVVAFAVGGCLPFDFERATVGIQLGIYDQKRLLDISEPSLDVTRQSIAAMQQAPVSIFGPPTEYLFGQVVANAANQTAPPEVWVAFERVVVQLLQDKDVAMIFGALPKSIAKTVQDSTSWLADTGGKVAGRCALSGASRKSANLWRYVSPTFNQLDCYTIDARKAPLNFLLVRNGSTTTVARLMFN